MLGIIGLLGLVLGLVGVVWLVAATLFRGPRRWAAGVSLVGLALFFGNMMVPLSNETREFTPTPTTTATPVLDLTAETRLPTVTVKEVRYPCSQPPVYGGSSSEFYDGSTRYSIMASASYAAMPSAPGGPQTVWVLMGIRNEKDVPIISNPRFDFSLMPLPNDATLPDPPQPTRVDVMEIAGPVLLPKGDALQLQPGTACSLSLTFQLPSDARRAALHIGNVQAFTIEL